MSNRQQAPQQAQGAPNLANPGRREMFRAVGPTVLLDVVLPYVVYVVLSQLGVKDVVALSVGGVISVLVVVVNAIRFRSLDRLAAFILITFVIGIGAAFLTGSARIVLTRESVYSGVIGLVLIASLAFGKPLPFQFAKQFMGGRGGGDWWDDRWNNAPQFRHTFVVITVVWGVVLMIDAVVRIPVVYALPVGTAAIVSPVLFLVAFVGLIIWTRRYIMFARRRAGQLVDAGPSRVQG